MNGGHFSDMELQEYAMDKSSCTKESIAHIEACSKCKAEALAYQMLFSGVKDQPKPLFDFDLSALVLEQLPSGQANQLPELAGVQQAGNYPKVWKFSFGTFLLALLSGCTIGIPLYLFRKNIWTLFDGISVFFMYFILAAAVIVVLFRIIIMYRGYQEQIRTLNYY